MKNKNYPTHPFSNYLVFHHFLYAGFLLKLKNNLHQVALKLSCLHRYVYLPVLSNKNKLEMPGLH